MGASHTVRTRHSADTHSGEFKSKELLHTRTQAFIRQAHIAHVMRRAIDRNKCTPEHKQNHQYAASMSAKTHNKVWKIGSCLKIEWLALHTRAYMRSVALSASVLQRVSTRESVRWSCSEKHFTVCRPTASGTSNSRRESHSAHTHTQTPHTHTR